MEKELLYQKIYNDLLQGIRTHKYPPGSRLPSEKELTEQYGVSRITSKKALEMLADRNFITRRPGKGSYVLENAGAEGEKSMALLPGAAAEGRGRLIGVVLDGFGAAYGSDIVNGIERECRKRNYHMILKCTYGNMAEESRAIGELIALGVEGIILMCVQGETYNADVLRLSVEQFPIVMIDRELTGLPIPCVCTDNYQASRDLMALLIERGHKDICFLSHPSMQTSSVAARFSGYLDSLLEHGLRTGEDMWLRNLQAFLPRMGEDEGEERADIKAVKNFIIKHPHVTGFFAVGLELGIMVYKILREMGQEKEKEVVFFDGIDEACDSNPVFSHVVQDEYLMGTMAVKYLKNRMEGKEVPKRYNVPYKVIRGEGQG
ncbi:MAG: GntR family transcriptional regulator [Lachnospiraceae bacterium]|jgi:GntR family transcriptional regulator of arabinose operon|nr:GntR family transcriptional regulator [Lachnospiraceae bacterium]